MSSSYKIFLLALIALGWSSIATAANPTSSSAAEPQPIPTISNFSLDDAFELATTPKRNVAIEALGGPTQMDCDSSTSVDGIETCVVTTEGRFASIPAAPAPR